jgi:hypothetical protein
VDRIQDFMADGTTKTCFTMIRIVSMLVFICHVMACLWVLVGRTGAQAGKVRTYPSMITTHIELTDICVSYCICVSGKLA